MQRRTRKAWLERRVGCEDGYLSHRVPLRKMKFSLEMACFGGFYFNGIFFLGGRTTCNGVPHPNSRGLVNLFPRDLRP